MEPGGTDRGGRGGKTGKITLNFLKKLRSPHLLRQQLGGLYFLALLILINPTFTAPARRWIFPSGALFFILGLAGRVWSSGFLVKNDLLTTRGPYGRVRNPIYVSNILVGAGLVLMNGYYWLVIFLILLYAACYLPGMRVEEDNLRRRYGPAFETYARTVPLIWPRLKVAEGYGGGSWRIRAYTENKEIYVTVGLLMGLGTMFFRRIAA